MSVFGRKSLASLVVIVAVVGYYATIPVPPDLSSSDYMTLRIAAFVMDVGQLLRSPYLPSHAHLYWTNGVAELVVTLIGRDDPSLRFRDMRTDDGNDGVKFRMYEPVAGNKKKRAGMVFIHGGGWSMGNPKTYHPLTQHLVASLEVVLISVDYRLSWEAPFPAAIDDCTKATTWFLRHAEEYNVDPSRIAIAGDSAGGNLAAAVSQRLTFNDEYADLPALTFQGLIYPSLQFVDFQTPSYQQNYDMPTKIITIRSVGYWVSHYLTGSSELIEPMMAENYTPVNADYARLLVSHDLIPACFKKRGYRPPRTQHKIGNEEVCKKYESVLMDPDVAPLLRENLAGLPPVYMITAQHDPLRDDGAMYVRRLQDANVEVTWKHYENGVHGMFNFFEGALVLESGKQSVREFINYSRNQLSR